jgi:sensor c-di-GMP phosphodiesterase-like protein
MSDRIVAEIRTALYAGDLFLEYLPVVLLNNGRCVGAEALIRWQRGREVIQPTEFIPAIENTSVSGLVTYWVIDTVAREMGQWLRNHPRVHMAINVPPEVFGRGGMEYTAAKSNILDLAAQFVVEITERGIPDRLGIKEINSRPRKGVLVALDDVCESASSLLIASELDVDIIKIEKSAVDSLTGARFSETLKASLSALIRRAPIAVVAEGVEEQFQAQRLLDFGIGFGQGWLFSRPLRAAQFKSYFEGLGH